MNILFTGWTAYDREQRHDSGEADAAVRLEDDLSAMGVQARHVEIDLAQPDDFYAANAHGRTFYPSECASDPRIRRRPSNAGSDSRRFRGRSRWQPLPVVAAPVFAEGAEIVKPLRQHAPALRVDLVGLREVLEVIDGPV